MGWRVAKQGKKSSGKPRGRPPATDGEKATDPVKLRPTFKMRLQRVAKKHGLDMGELVERQMGDWITAEYTAIVEQELAELRRKDKE